MMALFELKITNYQFDRIMQLLNYLKEAIKDHGRRTTEGLDKVAKTISDFEIPELPPALKILGGEFMYILANDQPDIPTTVSKVSATDAEGENVPLTENLVSDNPGVIDFVFDEGSSPSNPRSFKTHVGTSGFANVNYTASDPKGNIVHSEGAQFTITTGAIVNTSGGDMAFDGISEA